MLHHSAVTHSKAHPHDYVYRHCALLCLTCECVSIQPIHPESRMSLLFCLPAEVDWSIAGMQAQTMQHDVTANIFITWCMTLQLRSCLKKRLGNRSYKSKVRLSALLLVQKGRGCGHYCGSWRCE